MASILKKANGRWQARFRDPTGREHTQRFDRKVDAQRWLDRETAKMVRGDWIDPREGRVTVRTYADRWESVQVSSAGTKRVVDNALRLHLLPVLGDHPIGSVRPSTVQGFVSGLEVKGLSPGTVRVVYAIVRQVFAGAVDDRVISSTPCRRIRLPKDPEGEVVPPTVEQVAALADAIGDRWRALVVTLAGSGLRIGELLGLDVADVDFLRRTVRVERQRLQSGELGPVKSKSSRRVVPIGQIVVDELAAHLGPLADNLRTAGASDG